MVSTLPLIPVWLSNHTGLMHLNLLGNFFHGRIPGFLGMLSSLSSIDLSSNRFNTCMPVLFWNLTSLVCLDLSFNMFHGSVPADVKLCNLSVLNLRDNRFDGKLSSFIGNMSSNCLRYSLKDLNLGRNQFKGSIPNKIGEFKKLEQFDLSEWFDNISSNIRLLDLSDNLLFGHVPHMDGTMNPNLKIVNLRKNRFTGSNPANLCKVLSLIVLDLSHNKFSEILPECLGSLINLHVIDISNNSITGGVPSSFGLLSSLVSLHLHNNRFEGYLPATLQSLTRLVTMDIGNNLFTGSIPLWIGENLSSLRMLNLQSNKFTGKLPLQLCQLNTLQILNLAQNYICGMIPRCFGNLSGMIMDLDDYYHTSVYFYANGALDYEENIVAWMKGSELLYTRTTRFLTYLDLSSNNITGEIPDVLMNLEGLENLNLSRNLLKDQIPKTIGNLTKVESLDLSMNKLSGQIPTSLGTLHSISHLNRSFNNLSGPIPTGNQLQTLDNPSSIYEGNVGLCGPPLARGCKGNESSYNHVDENEAQDDTKDLWFYVGMGSGFAVGFIGLLGSLHFIRSWRIAYFETLENVYGWLMLSIQLNLARIRRKFF